jgi:hypothetical protein
MSRGQFLHMLFRLHLRSEIVQRGAPSAPVRPLRQHDDLQKPYVVLKRQEKTDLSS